MIRKTTLLTLALLPLVGCQTLREPEELTWQALHIADMAMTFDGNRDECYRESHPIPKHILGSKPSQHGIVAYAVASAGIHLLISDLLLSQGMERTYRWWQAISIADTSVAVGMNHGIGVRLGKRNKLWCSK